MALEFPPLYLLKSHFEKIPDELQRLEQEIGVVWNLEEAKYVLGKPRNKSRAALELSKLGWRTEDVNENNGNGFILQESALPRKKQKLDKVNGKDIITLDSDTESASEHDTPSHKKATASSSSHPVSGGSRTFKSTGKPVSDCKTIKVLHLDWYTDSLKAGRLVPIEKYLVYEGRVVGVSKAPPTEHKATVLPSKSKTRVRDDTPPVISQKSFNRSFNKHGGQRYRGNASQGSYSFNPPVSLQPESTEEYEDISNLPPIPDYLHTRYSCQRPTHLHCPNEAFLSQLRIIKKARTLKDDKISIRSYSAAIATLASYPYTLTSRFEVARLPCCGPKIATVWQLWNDMGRIPEVDEVEADEQVKIMAMFYDIHGVAEKTAREFWNKGWRDLDDIVEHGWDSISRIQQIGIKYYDELLQRIPRTEVEETAKVILDCANRIHGGFQMVICGGYRRGKSDSGDVDVVLSHPDKEVTEGFLPQLTANLEDDCWITHILEISMTNSKYGQHSVRWKGIVPKSRSGFDSLDHAFVIWQNPRWPTEKEDLKRNLTAKNPNIHRRVDIIISPWKTAGCAVLGWTGGTMFERDLRNYSRHELGWKFDSSGVRSVAEGTWIDLEQGAEDLLAKERKVFEGLKLQWREPTERCTD